MRGVRAWVAGLTVAFALATAGLLPAQGVTRDAGDIAIIEHDGSNYDAHLQSGELNLEAREWVGARFYETHGDDYDFLVVFTNFDFQTSDATAFHLAARSSVSGIGKPIGAVGPAAFGSPARLQGWIDMASVAQYRAGSFSLTPGELGFLRTLNVLAHEVGHQWLAEARFLDGGAVSDALRGRDGNHWSYLLDSDASLMYGADWHDDGSGTHTAVRVKERYSELDRYLMGLLAPEDVDPITLLVNPTIDHTKFSDEGAVVSATPTTVVIDQLVAAMGERQPDHRHSQKDFRLGFVFLTAPGTEPSPRDLAAVERVRQTFGAHFFGLTHGVAWADTSLAVLPPAPRAPIPDLGRALSWLLARQELDGTWADSPGTSLRDTATVVQALARAGATGPAWQRGLSWLQGARSESLDFSARRDAALADLRVLGADRTARATLLLARQNADGGLGAGLDFASDALDTALALRALRTLGHPADARVSAAIGALQSLQSADGGWAAVPGGETSTVVTAEVLLALADWPDVPASSTLQASGLIALLARRNADGGFGASPSSPFASALALEVLLRTGGPPDLVDPLVAWLRQSQLADGSWAGSPFQTALVLGALSDSLGANLTVPADSLILNPSPAQEGDIVQVSARVRNAGRADVPPSVARLFDGAPGVSPVVAEAAVPALAPGQEAAVSFDFPTTDRPGARTLFVVADAAEEVPESREDDNTTARTLTVVGLLADLVLTPADIAVSPAAPEIGEDAAIQITVANAGERVAADFEVQVAVTDPEDRTAVLSPVTVTAVGAGETALVSFPWTPAQDGEFVISATADARYRVPESNETNGEAARRVEVLDEVPANPELAVGPVSFSPESVSELPQVVQVSILVENRGRAAAGTTLEVWDDETGAFLAAADVALAGRSSALVAVDVTIATPGDRPVFVMVDPDDDFPEDNELDNEAVAILRGDHARDIEVLTATPLPPEIEQGERVQVRVELRNRGTLDLLAAPVQLAQHTAGGPVELSRTSVDLAAGESTAVDLWWRVVAPPGDLSLLIRADPFDLLEESREDNNSVPLSLRVLSSGLPNLTASGADLVIEPDPPVEGEEATVLALVRNAGDAPAGPFLVSVFVGDPDEGGTLLGQAALGGLPPGGEERVEIPWSPVDLRGSLGLYALVDPDDEVEEADEDDNLAFRPFVSLGLPDLVLTRAAVTLDPAYPREGESVTITATVRNLGDQPSGETTLLVTEKEPEADVIGLLTVPGLSPGALTTSSLSWTPSSPFGDRPVRLTVDPEDDVVEQDEGNNTVRTVVVIQDADLYLTAPFFSPNGDGVLDATTLGWRATVPVGIVATNHRGERVRALVEDGPESGSVTWDGRDAGGAIALDGNYTLSVTGEGGAVLAEIQVALDTNRSPLHDVLGPGETAARNVSCPLPGETDFDAAWSPGEESLLVVLRYPGEGWEPGLVRLGLDGDYAYVARDPWYNQAAFVSEAAVSPDGTEILVNHRGDLVAVDLLSGARRELGSTLGPARWSPDGRWIQVDDRVLSRDGAHVADLPGDPYLEWAWAPRSDRLAQGGTVVARNGTILLEVPLDPEQEYANLAWTTWRGDGQIAAELDSCAEVDLLPGVTAADEEEGSCRRWFVVDPETGDTSTLPVTSWGRPSWSPDGRRYITRDAGVFEEDGTPVVRLSVPDSVRVSPRSGAGLFNNWRQSGHPGAICSDKNSDTFALVTLANLSAHLDVQRLAGNGGLVLRGTAADRHLESFELDYARVGEPETWHPIGPAFDVPVVNDAFTVWVPEEPGTYVVRLRIRDRAGNETVRTRTVRWNRVASIVNFTQSSYFLSPDDNLVKDEVVFRYTVVEPVRLDVRIVGPEPETPEGPDPAEVRHEAFELTDSGPRSFTWGAENDTGQIVPDGRYTVFLNDLPFRVEVDTTPPEVGMQVQNVRPQQTLHWTELGPACLRPTTQPPDIPTPTTWLGVVYRDRVWHVVDRNLKSWAIHSATSQGRDWPQPVFVPETNELGEPTLANGVPRVKRAGGRPVGRVDTLRGSPLAYERRLVAVDHAGNSSEIVVPPAREQVWALGAEHECDPLMPAPVDPEPGVHGLAPENVVFKAHTNADTTEGRRSLRLALQPRGGGAWEELPAPEGYVPIESFLAEGIDPTRTWRGRFLADGAVEPLASDDFLFDPCPRFVRAEMDGRVLVVEHRLPEPVVEAWATLQLWTPGSPPAWQPLGRFRMAPDSHQPDRFYLLPPEHSCTRNLRFQVELLGASGVSYPNSGFPDQCARVSGKSGGDASSGSGSSRSSPDAEAPPTS